MKRILIIGASSAIAEHCGRHWASKGEQIYLIGRNQERVSRIASDFRVRGASKVGFHCMDLNDIGEHAAALDAAEHELGEVDVVLIAHGTLSNQDECKRNVDLMMHEIRTNALSVVALLTLLANRFEARRTGTIAVISSVAGDRGRQSNYVYGCAKALVSTFASGLQQRLSRSGVHLVIVKPGPVDTPMTGHLRKGILWTRPDAVASAIVRAIDRRRGMLYVPWFWRPIMYAIIAIPNSIYKKMTL